MSNSETQEPREPIQVDAVVLIMIEQMAGLGWQKMGLQPDPITHQMDVDFVQARKAIDITAYLAGLIEPDLDADDKRQLQNLVRDLRMNYVNKVGKQG